MNAGFVTRAAEGLPRRGFTVAEVEAMVKAGILREDERFELIGGEVVPMSPKGSRHELLKALLTHSWVPRCPPGTLLLSETTLRLSEGMLLEPDIAIFRTEGDDVAFDVDHLLIAVEISDTTLGYDLKVKAPIYARHGVEELWVIDTTRLVTHVHRDPSGDTYGSVDIRDRLAHLEPHALPMLGGTLQSMLGSLWRG